ncbi:hypothetical protein [Maricaulis sp.]
MLHAAKQFGISGNGLAKICKRLEIPYPPRGYWAQVQAGKKPKKAPLRAAGARTPEATVIRPTPSPAPPRPDPIGDAVRAAEDIPEVPVPADLRRSHPIVAAWVEEDQRRRRESRHNSWSVHTPTTDLDKRIWRIKSALFKVLEKRGHEIEHERGRPRVLWFVIDSERINFSLYERVRHRKERLTAEERRNRESWLSQTWKQWTEPTGLLKFSAHAEIMGKHRQKEWEEKEGAPIEGRLGKIVIALEAMAVLAAEERARRAEQERIRREEEHRHYLARRAREHDQKRWNRFRQMATDWEECDRLRRFIAVLESEAVALVEPSPQLEERIAWARARLNAMDPMAEGATGVAARIEAVSEWD